MYSPNWTITYTLASIPNHDGGSAIGKKEFRCKLPLEVDSAFRRMTDEYQDYYGLDAHKLIEGVSEEGVKLWRLDEPVPIPFPEVNNVRMLLNKENPLIITDRDNFEYSFTGEKPS